MYFKENKTKIKEEHYTNLSFCENKYKGIRDTKRIPIIIDKLGEVWQRYPLDTFSGLIDRMSELYKDSVYKSVDPFFLEEDDWYVFFQMFLDETQEIAELSDDEKTILSLLEMIWLHNEDFRFTQFLNSLPILTKFEDKEVIELLKEEIKQIEKYEQDRATKMIEKIDNGEFDEYLLYMKFSKKEFRDHWVKESKKYGKN